ncbi:alpha/beta fold hydrolase [Brachybacterium sp. p3-SID957]|uniref:alpha/beta fold hydrolase n=1 Tax=Brachybacterium sp. p3-SID957 TaxID=2916049 RepID=UPI00223C3131|nr:alpha/beta hydrolase [Brachybacterium sp. p3-SID957]MCT1776159.1 alpha/beta hydrolase [Brachybacterium sp. p3-SID957]
MTEAPRWVEREDVRLAVADTGGKGPVVVLLHGLAGSSRELMPTARALSATHRVLLLGQRGYGHSTRRPEDRCRDAIAGDVLTTIEQLLPGAPVSLVGQSMGAHTARLAGPRRLDRGAAGLPGTGPGFGHVPRRRPLTRPARP